MEFRSTAVVYCALVVACMAEESDFLEFEGPSIPAGIRTEKSTITLDTRHRYRGEQALRWDWQSGATLRIDRPVECRPELNRMEEGFQRTRSFKFWIYSEKALPNNQLRVVFGDDQGEPCSFPFNLDFTGWRSAWISFERDMEGAPDRDLSFIRFEAPDNAETGTFWIDDMAPSLSIYIEHHMADRQVPFVNASMQDLLLALPHDTNILIDKKVIPRWDETEMTAAHRAAFCEVEANIRPLYPPVRSKVDELLAIVETYHIVKDADGTIRGDFLPHLASHSHMAGLPKRFRPEMKALTETHDFWAYSDLMLEIAQAYAYWENQPEGAAQAESLKASFILMSEHLLDQGWQAGSGLGSTHLFGYSSRSWPPAVFLMRTELAEAGLLQSMADSLLWFFNVKKHFLPPSSHLCDMDYLKTTSLSDLLSIMVMPDSAEKVLYLDAFQNSFGNILALASPGSQDGIKSDGGLFHHQMHYEGYGIPGIKGAARLFEILDGTHYELSVAAYTHLKMAYLSAQLWGYPYAGFNACGRHPLLCESELFSASMLGLAKAAPNTDSFDPDLAAAYLDMEGGDAIEIFGQPVESKSPQGAGTMNYHSGGVYKHGNSTVLFKGFCDGIISHETFALDNRYGSYGSHGTIQIFENTRLHTSGFERPGWSWSQPPGATTLALPLDVLEGDVGFHGRRIPQQTPFAGCSDLDHKIGLFAFQLDPDPANSHPEALKVRKSVLSIDGKLIALGSGLSNGSSYPLVTTLFQCGLRSDQKTVKQGDGWIIDPYGTGHWVPPKNRLKQKIGIQTSRHNKTKEPTEGEFAIAWIDHGVGAQNADYEYVSVLEADAATMEAISTAPIHFVKRCDDRTHAVWIPSENVWSLVNFLPLEEPVGPVLSINQPCLVLLKQLADGGIRMSVTDPRLNLTMTTTAPPVEVALRIKGRFAVSEKSSSPVSAIVEGEQTLLLVHCAEGMPTAFSLNAL